MLERLRAQNFKSWKDTGDIRIAPLTGFFGTNSSGKTSLLQLLLMLKQTVESSDRQRILHFGNDKTYVDLGTSYDIIHNHQLPDKLSFSLSWKPQQVLSIGTKTATFHHYESSIEFTSEIMLEPERMTIEQFYYGLDDEVIKSSKIGIQRRNSSARISKYKLLLEGLFSEAVGEQSISIQPVKSYGFPTIRNYSGLFSELTLLFEFLFQQMYYLAPLREYPQRIYAWSGEQPQDVGKRGEETVAALLASRQFADQRQTVEEFVAEWLQDLGLVHEFRLARIAESRREFEVKVKVTPNSTEVPLTDVGFGVSQVLPVLTLCYYVPEGSTIILEQPEIHLHPSVQAGLADVFIHVIKTRNVQIILESHSEHLLRRLQLRIAEEKLELKNTDAALYFCKMTDAGQSELTSLNVDEFGNITNYPPNFFGDEMGDLVAMTEAAMRRQQANL